MLGFSKNIHRMSIEIIYSDLSIGQEVVTQRRKLKEERKQSSPETNDRVSAYKYTTILHCLGHVDCSVYEFKTAKPLYRLFLTAGPSN